MASFWDEIAKQYNNAENRYRENLNAGLGMLNNKANMIQQGYANAMNTIGQQANILGQSMNIPAQFAQLLANREENALTRDIQQDQFNKEYALNQADTASNIAYRKGQLANEAKRLGIEKTKAENESTILEMNVKEFLNKQDKQKREEASSQASASELLGGYTHPKIVSFIAKKRKEKIDDNTILNMVTSNIWNKED